MGDRVRRRRLLCFRCLCYCSRFQNGNDVARVVVVVVVVVASTLFFCSDLRKRARESLVQ